MAKTPTGIYGLANAMFSYRMMCLFVDKGLLTKQEAARPFAESANDIRSGSEDDLGAATGEALAQEYEKLAAWMLGMRYRDGEKGS